MDKFKMCHLLPEDPPDGLVEWAREKYGREELGGEFCVFTSERIEIEPTAAEVLEYNSLRPRRKEWAAVCSCSWCSEDFITQKEPGENAIRLVAGEDGWNYTVTPGEAVDPYMGIEINREGDRFLCPLCGSEVELIHKRKLQGGRKKQIMILSVQNVDGYTSIIYWMVQRWIEETGISHYGATPEEAYVLTENGGLTRFSHVQRHGAWYGSNRSYLSGWKLMSNNEDVIDKVYPDWRSINNRKAGADIWPQYPNLEGTTGEKTALIEYLRADGYRPVAYLKFWRRWRNVENLCRQGQAKLVAEIVSQAWRYSYSVDSEASKYIDRSKRKPHEMLGMSKEEFRWLRDKNLTLTTEAMNQWRAYRRNGGKLTLAEFMTYAKEFRTSGMNAALELIDTYGDADLDKIARYLKKSGLNLSEAGILLDTRNCIKKIYNRQLTSEELWPKHLHETHDRVHRMLREQRNKEEADKMLAGFRKILDSYSHLQWNDGELEVILPRNNGELVYEGDVLRHCVGGYGNAHINGTSVIFFIRHHRRPERPYYTLAIDMTGRPKERQLHGYGNERHGPQKEYIHRIPKKVRSFCDRWKNEVLLAWYAEQKKQDKEKTA